MFCSLCKRVEFQLDDKTMRKICDSGHIFCQLCDKDYQDCSICGARIANLIFIEIQNDIPRLQISSIEHTSDCEDDKVELEKPHNSSNDSIKELTEQLKEYDLQCNKGQKKDEHPKIGCVQVVNHINPPIAYTLSLDVTEEELELMKNFEIVAKNGPKNYPSFGEGDGNSLVVNQPCSSSSFTRSHSPTYTTRSDCYGSRENFSFHDTPIEIYRNDRTSLESFSTHFTALNPPQVDLSPPEKNSLIPSNAQRVKFTPVFECEHKIPAQMEPLGMFNDVDCNSIGSEFLENISLSRMPVTCPISTCGASSLPSNFYNHIVTDHPYINIVKLATQKIANFTVCPAGNLVMCHRMFLVEGKLYNIGYGFDKHCLPIIIVSAKINLQQLFGSSSKPQNPSDEVYCIWPLSIFEYPVKFTLTVWTHGKDDTEPTLIRCLSSIVPFLSSRLNSHEIFNNSLVLTKPMVEDLVSNDSMISCQIVFN